MGIVIILAGMVLYGIGVLTGVYVGYSMQKEISKRDRTKK